MTQDTIGPRLPFELILRIVESLRPETAVALPRNDPAALAFKAFMLTCRMTYPTALRLLYSHCLYIDSSDRLRRLLISLNHHLNIVHPIDLDKDNLPETSITTKPPASPSTLPQVNLQPHLQNLYISPFSPTTIDDLPTAQWIFELFSIVRHTLRRLISVMPLSTLPPWKDHLSVRSWLRRGFEELSALEEFVCVCDELDLTVYEEVFSSDTRPEIPIWAKWTNLRRLSLRKFDMARPRFAYLKELPLLESFVMIVTLHPFSQQTWNVVFDRFTKDRVADVQLIWPAVARHDSNVRDWGGDEYHLARIRWADEWNAAAHSQSKIKFKAVAIDPKYAPDEEEGERHLLHLQTWMTERAVEGSWWDVDACRRWKRSEIDADLYFDSTTAKGTWPEEWRMDVVTEAEVAGRFSESIALGV